MNIKDYIKYIKNDTNKIEQFLIFTGFGTIILTLILICIQSLWSIFLIVLICIIAYYLGKYFFKLIDYFMNRK